MAEMIAELPGDPSVQPWLSTLNGYAGNSFAAASSLAASLSAYRGAEFSASISAVGVSGAIGAISEATLAPPPPYPGSTAVKPKEYGILPANHVLVQPPLFDAEELVITLPTVPTTDEVSKPEKSEIDLSHEFPLEPNTALPEEIILEPIVIPEVPTIVFPEFEGSVDLSQIQPPSNSFYFNEDPFSDELLDKVKSELLIRLAGGTGLAENVERGIWDRGKDRESRTLELSKQEIISKLSRGFSRPTGSLMAAIDRAVQESHGKIVELSREVMIKQAELEQENIKNSIQQTIVLEDILLREHNNVQQRSFEVAKVMQDIAIQVYTATLSKYNLEVELYKTDAAVFDTLVKQELSKLEVFKTEVEAQSLISDINKNYVDIYNSRVEGIKTTVESYGISVQAVSEKLKAEAIKIEAFKSEIEAYTSEIQANTEKYKQYSSQVEAESVKADINETRVKSYASKVQAYATEQSANDASAKIHIEQESLKLNAYLTKLEKYLKELQVEQMNYQTLSDNYKNKVQAYSAKSNKYVADAEVRVKQFQAGIQENQYNMSRGLELIKLSSELVRAENSTRVEALKAAGSVHAQLASSALNAINVSASTNSNLINNLSENYNFSGAI